MQGRHIPDPPATMLECSKCSYVLPKNNVSQIYSTRHGALNLPHLTWPTLMSFRNALTVRDDPQCLAWHPSVPSRRPSTFSHVRVFELPSSPEAPQVWIFPQFNEYSRLLPPSRPSPPCSRRLQYQSSLSQIQPPRAKHSVNQH